MPFAEWTLHVALAAATATGWLGLGWIVLARVRTGDVLLDALNGIGAGAVTFALLTFGAAALGVLYAALYAPMLAGCAAVGLVTLWRLRGVARLPRLAHWPRWQLAAAAAIVVWAAATGLAAGAPVTTFDALHYHASAPARYVEAHRLLELEWGWSTYQPFTVEMLVADGAMTWNSVQGAFAPYLLALFAIVAAAGMGARLGGRPVAVLAGATFTAQGLLAFEASGTLIETGMAFVTALAAWNAALFVAGRSTPALALAAAFAGAAAGMKYVGLFVPLAVGVGLLVALRRRATLRHALLFALVATLVALPWYLKNVVQTGNPVFPFVFGGTSGEALRFVEGGIGEHGAGKSASDALLLPFRLLADGDAFDRGSWLSPLPLLFAPVALLDTRVRALSVPALVGAAAFLVAWFTTSQQARFLLVIGPVASVLAAVGMLALARRGAVGRVVTATVASAAIATGLALTLAYTVQFAPVAAGVADREEFLEASTPYYDGVRWLNRALQADDRALVDFAAVLYLEDAHVVWTPLVLSTFATPGEARRFAREEELTHAAVLEVNLAARRPTLAALGARRIATVPVHAPVFGVRIRRGQPERLHVYELALP